MPDSGQRQEAVQVAAGDIDGATIAAAEQAAMHRALALAERVRGRTSPNPAVAAAGTAARGGTAVVTLEPCAHTGRTGPCVDALIEAGVARVVYAVDDPNPEAAGGADALRSAGIDVVGGVDTHAAESGALRPWLHAVRSGRPFVTWKYAATLDGRVAAADYTSQWISSPLSRADVHALRGVVDAIMVGSGTVLADDPRLTVRDGERTVDEQPLRVVLDRRHQVPDDARVLDGSAQTLVLDTAAPSFALKALYDRGVRHVLLEGGPTLAGAFVAAGCVDEVVAYLAPMLLGAGPSALGPADIGTLADAATLEIESVTRIGDDIKVVARPRWTDDDTDDDTDDEEV